MSQIPQLAQMVRDAKRAVAFTGAGISTESGIPDFRSPGGVWSKYEPVYFQDFLANANSRHEYWRQKTESHQQFFKSKPNDGHRTLATWQKRGQLVGVITQNIDELHQQAGSENVLELHGTARRVSCLDCGYLTSADDLNLSFLETHRVPDCPKCSGRLKHATISFGQTLPRSVLETAYRWSTEADLFLALGSSLLVTPAAELPRLAKKSGARLVIIARDETPLDSIADLVIHESIGKTLVEAERLLVENSQGRASLDH